MCTQVTKVYSSIQSVTAYQVRTIATVATETREYSLFLNQAYRHAKERTRCHWAAPGPLCQKSYDLAKNLRQVWDFWGWQGPKINFDYQQLGDRQTVLGSAMHILPEIQDAARLRHMAEIAFETLDSDSIFQTLDDAQFVIVPVRAAVVAEGFTKNMSKEFASMHGARTLLALAIKDLRTNKQMDSVWSTQKHENIPPA